jgi:hypothetical protein
MHKKYQFPFTPGDRVKVPGTKSKVQGLIAFPVSKIVTLAEPAKPSRMRRADKLPPAPHPAESEGRIIFVAWIGEDGLRQRGYFTEAALYKAVGDEFIADDIALAIATRN